VRKEKKTTCNEKRKRRRKKRPGISDFGENQPRAISDRGTCCFMALSVIFEFRDILGQIEQQQQKRF
jgi:hypothetical protein